MYSIQFFSSNQYHQLEDIWASLGNGADMTYFQGYAWNSMLAQMMPPACRHFETVFALVSREGKPVLIAPLWVVKHDFRFVNKKGCYFIGLQGWSDYLNFIYKEFDALALDNLLSEIQRHYRVSTFHFDNIQENTAVYQYLASHYTLTEDRRTTCVRVRIPQNREEYIKSLHKSARGNLRTAANRVEKDGIGMTFDFDNCKVDKSLCMKLYTFGYKKKNQFAFRDRIKKKIIDFFNYSFPPYNPITHDRNSHFLTSIAADKTLCSFFNYGYTSHRHELVVMAVGTNPDYYRYSPGILSVYNFILHHIDKQDVQIIDFTRGTERYKYDIGGEEHYIHSIVFTL